MENETRYHDCKALKNIDDISIQRIQGNWCWVFWGTKKGGPMAQGIGYCPYCGKELYAEMSVDDPKSLLKMESKYMKDIYTAVSR